MPIIDMFNHSRHGAPFAVADQAVTIYTSHAGGDSQAFAQYGSRRDALDRALRYGYVDPSVPYARSMPAIVDVEPLGRVEVLGQWRRGQHVLDPPTVAIDADRLELSHLTFHAAHPDRMHALIELFVVAALRHNGDTSSNSAVVTAAVLGAIGSANLDALQLAEAAIATRDEPSIATLRTAIAVQREVIARAIGG